MTTYDPTSIDCTTACVNGCVLGDQCPHREAAQAAIKYVMETDWDDLMQRAEDRIPSNPMAVLDFYEQSGGQLSDS